MCAKDYRIKEMQDIAEFRKDTKRREDYETE
jgi:hypothetical protein